MRLKTRDEPPQGCGQSGPAVAGFSLPEVSGGQAGSGGGRMAVCQWQAFGTGLEKIFLFVFICIFFTYKKFCEIAFELQE